MTLNVSERSLFLHFINREIQFLRGDKLSEFDHIVLIKLCGLMTTGFMLAPFAQVHEIYGRRKLVNNLIVRLAKAEQLQLISGAPDYPTFIESRQLLYASRQDRYRAYFDDKKHNKDLYTPSHLLDTTGFIKQALLSAVTPSSRGSNIFSAEEKQRVMNHAAFVRSEFLDNPHAATYSLYEKQSVFPKPQEVRFLGNLSARLFIKHYADEHDLLTPTGVFSDVLLETYDGFPYFDVKLQQVIVERLALGQEVNDVEFHDPYMNIILGKDFRWFVEARNQLLRLVALVSEVDDTLGANNLIKCMPVLQSMDFGESVPGPASAARLAQRMEQICRIACARDPRFAKAREALNVKPAEVSRVIVCTATPLEDEIFRSSAAIAGYLPLEPETFVEFTSLCYRRLDGTEIWHLRTSAGTLGVHSSARMSEIAIRELRPRFVFSVGIAFGLYEDKHAAGDVIVAETIFQYERAKITRRRVERRGDIIPCAYEAQSFATQYQPLDNKFTVHTGVMHSGDKLVNDPVFRDKLRKLEPKAIGGDMEAAGIAQACVAHGVKFVMIKGISDFGANKNDKDQPRAAANAARLLFDMIAKFDAAGTFKAPG